jgi:hypothetical protein
LEGRKKVGKTQLNGELARDEKHASSLAGAEWADGPLRTSLHVRDINKNFTTVTNAPSGQGEIGATWTADGDWNSLSASATADIFQDRINPNPDNPQALNYDTSANVRVPLNDDVALDTNAHYVNNPGQISPRRFTSGSARVSATFDVWGNRKGTVFTGGSVKGLVMPLCRRLNMTAVLLFPVFKSL